MNSDISLEERRHWRGGVKEVVFFPAFVCLSVCSQGNSKRCSGISMKLFLRGGIYDQQELIRS